MGRYRWMYYLTGLPGWMRFGFSPGWGGLPPGAQFLLTGTWPTPQAQAFWSALQAGQVPFLGGVWAPAGGSQLDLLRTQADALRAQLEQIQKQIEQLEKSEK